MDLGVGGGETPSQGLAEDGQNTPCCEAEDRQDSLVDLPKGTKLMLGSIAFCFMSPNAYIVATDVAVYYCQPTNQACTYICS
jgi:hypothetical protein